MKVLEGSPANELEGMLHEARRLAGRMRQRRFREGSLDLDFPESKIRLDERGRVKRIEQCENDASHQLIEEFMLLANEAVAKRLKKMKRPSIHRVHERPDPRRLREYREEVLSHNVPCGNLEKPAEVQKLLARLGDLAIGPALKVGFLKSLMRARYSVKPMGHYGLAKADYAHFTSPIRRYADLVVHRSLFADKADAGGPALRETAAHVSTTERNSADAERDSKDVKMYAYLKGQLKSRNPHRYPALVTDVRNFGFFVDVTDLGMSGLVPLSLLDDDFYEFDSARVQIRGRSNRRLIKLGDRVVVEVAKVDSYKKQVDFRLVPTTGKTGRAKAKRARAEQRPSGADGKRGGAKKKEASGSHRGRPRRRRSNKRKDTR
jgi:ribonuclease R